MPLRLGSAGSKCSARSAACRCGLPGSAQSQDGSVAAMACCPACGSRRRDSCLWRQSGLQVNPTRQTDRAAHLTGRCLHCSGMWACLLEVAASGCRRLHRAAGSQRGAAGCPGTAPTSCQAAAPRLYLSQIPLQGRLLAVASCSQGRACSVEAEQLYVGPESGAHGQSDAWRLPALTSNAYPGDMHAGHHCTGSETCLAASL